MDLTKHKKTCSKCGEEKTLDKLFRCADCYKVFCNEHASYPGMALCLKCYDIWYKKQTKEHKEFLAELGRDGVKVYRVPKPKESK